MKIFENTLGRIVALFGLFVNHLWGGWDVALKTLLIVMALDFATGILCAVYNKKLSSVKAFEGAIKKMFVLTMVTLATQFDYITNANGYMRSFVLFYYIAIDMISIVENASHFIPVPDKFIESLEQLQKGNKKEKNN